MTADTGSTIRALLVDDDAALVKYLRILLQRTRVPFEIDAVDNGQDGLRILAEGAHHVCLLDYRLAEEDGLALLRRARHRKLRTPIILLTGGRDEQLEFTALEEGAADYLNKADLDPARLEHVIGGTIARHRADVALHLRERRVAEAEASALVMPAEIGLDGRWLRVSRRLCQTLGYTEEELLHMHVPALIYRDDLSVFEGNRRRLLDAGVGSVEAERRYLRRDGEVVWMYQSCALVTGDDGIPLYVMTHLRDISEQKRLEERLRQAQKMEAIGHLAGGVAHDFNNLLTAILGYADLLKDEVGDGSEAQADLAEVRNAARSAAALTEQLLAFSRKQLLKPEIVSMNAVIGGMRTVLERALGAGITLVTRLGDGVPAIEADPVQLQQVLLNLAANARDAMPRGGEFVIDTSRRTRAQPCAGAPDGEFVVMTVADTGCGMDREVRSRIFEPFFTTKPAGQGTGLGLATVYGIVTQSGGEIVCDSAPGAGTTFSIVLPVIDKMEAALAPASAADRGRGTETVLLVEDQPAVRRLTRRILETRGYRVLDTGEPEEALHLGARGEVDLLLTDVIMPGMSGPELAARIRSQLPGMPVMFMSGFTGHSALDDTRDAPFIRKPFTPEDLVRKVQDALAQRERTVP